MLGKIRGRRDDRPRQGIGDGPPLWFEPDPARAERERERLTERRREQARAERQRVAEAELERLRRWHWDPQRLLDEARGSAEWWEAPDADPYAVLGLVPGATVEEASVARRRVAVACHPDVLVAEGDLDPDDERMRRMRAANAAYDRIRRALLALN